jgi:hypothetical protein
VNLFAQLFFAKFVQREELLGQFDVLNETATGQLDTQDDLSVGHHHGHCAKVDFQVLGQLLTPSIAWVHGQEDAKLGIHVDNVAVGEYELPLALFLASQNDVDLLSGHGQDGQLDAIELVKATP